MIGIIVLLALSWVIFYVFEKTNLKLLFGSNPLSRSKDFLDAFLLFLLLSVLFSLIDTVLKDIQWVWNSPDFSVILSSLWYQTKSVITEELIFRGALLYLGIKLIGEKKALYLSSAAFGIYHWFSYGVLGNITLMIFVFAITAWMGFVWAYAYIKTQTIFWAVGAHLAWNFSRTLWYPGQPFGELLFIGETLNNKEPHGTIAYLLTGFLAPLLALLYLRFIKKTNPQSPL